VGASKGGKWGGKVAWVRNGTGMAERIKKADKEN